CGAHRRRSGGGRRPSSAGAKGRMGALLHTGRRRIRRYLSPRVFTRHSASRFMKLRLYNDSLRLRLSQSEVAQFEEAGRVESAVPFQSGRSLIYSIAAAAVAELSATLNDGRMAVLVPKPMARIWLSPDQTGMENSSSTPRILIEKDFQCLHRSTEEVADGFPNPSEALKPAFRLATGTRRAWPYSHGTRPGWCW